MSPPHLSLIETSAPSFPAVVTRPLERPGAIFRATPHRPAPARKPLGQILLDMKAVEPENLLRALGLRDRQDIRLGDILLTRGWVREADLTAALCLQWQARALDLIAEPPDPRLLDRLGTEFCLTHGVLPWRRGGGATVIATARPEAFDRVRAALPRGFGAVIMALAPETDIREALVRARSASLARRAETRVPEAESCRGQNGRTAQRIGVGALAVLALALLALPQLTIALLSLWALLTLVATTGLKIATGGATIRASMTRRAEEPPPLPAKLPVISMMVPLFREDDIAPRLLQRLGRIDYPKELLDILLVTEEDDVATRTALRRHKLPRWMRIVTVPDGPVRTKPRALNFALDFCRGSIVGVWDAEDAPDPGQIIEVARRFAAAPADVACLQGVLDFYNARHNWLTRCFTIDYAVWFRAILPGLARLGLVVPLGGTTLFFRREAIEKLGGWDAHNVTEDADLGLRLARHGYRTELIRTVTEEEPNARVLSWLRQRSRWQKGYAVTWASHMRDPAQLWRDLGAKRFWGVQVLFLGSLTEAILAPILLSYWFIALGLPHPLAGVIPPWVMATAGAIFVVSEGVSLSLGLWAVRGRKHRHLIPWLPLMHLYAPLASLSSYKALWEWVTSPFYWDKTSHGVVDTGPEPEVEPSVLMLCDPVYVPPSVVTPLTLRHHLRSAPAARLHFTALPADLAPPTTEAPDPDALRAQIRLVVGARRTPYVTGSTVAQASRRPGIEFQASFEGF
jgi:glycosyltransferase XagB